LIRIFYQVNFKITDMAGDDLVELKFRLYDGTDIGPNNYAPATTVGTLKESILAQWPSGNHLVLAWRFLLFSCCKVAL
jgi:hypothetical protein